MKRLLAALLLVAAAAAACGESANPPPAAVPSATPSPGMTLDQEVGAVIMSGFRGPISDSVVADWHTHQCVRLASTSTWGRSPMCAQVRPRSCGAAATAPRRTGSRPELVPSWMASTPPACCRPPSTFRAMATRRSAQRHRCPESMSRSMRSAPATCRHSQRPSRTAVTSSCSATFSIPPSTPTGRPTCRRRPSRSCAPSCTSRAPSSPTTCRWARSPRALRLRRLRSSS